MTSPLRERLSEFESSFDRRTVGGGSTATNYAIRRGTDEQSVAFLPGGVGSASAWFDQAVRLGRRRTAVLIDQPPSPVVEDQVEAILGVLDRERLGRVAVVGTSLGGMLAHVLAKHAPERVEAQVLCSSGIYDGSHRGDLRRSLWMAKALPERLLRSGAMRRISRLAADGPDADVWIPLLCEPFLTGSPRMMLVRQQRLLLELVDRWPQLTAGTTWSGPTTLIVRAADDPLMPEEATERLVVAHPGAIVRRFPSGGHLLAVTRPDDIADAIAELLDAP